MLLKIFAGENVFKKIINKKVKLLTYVVAIFVFILVLSSCVNIYKSCEVIKKQADSNLTSLVDSIRKNLNSYLDNYEDEVTHSKDMIELTIDGKKITSIKKKYNKNQIPYIEKYLNSMVSPILIHSAENVESLYGIYFMFDPELIREKHILGLWYLKPENKNDFVLLDNGYASTMYPQNRADLEWYYLPKKNKAGVWSRPYVDDDLKVGMVTYSTPIYKNNTFIGVAGMDISVAKFREFLAKFKIYRTGNIYLVSSDNKIISANDYEFLKSTSSIDKNLYNYLQTKKTLDEVTLIKSSSKKALFAVARLENGYTVIMEVSSGELYDEVIKLLIFTSYSLILAVLVSLLIAIRAYAMVKKINNELMHKEKLISMGTMAAEIAHEINNPISYISCNIDTLKKFLEKMKYFDRTCAMKVRETIQNKISFEEGIKVIEDLKQELKIDYVLDSFEEIIAESKDGINRVANIVLNLKNFSKDSNVEAKSKESLEKIIDESLMILNNKLVNRVEIIRNFDNIESVSCYKSQLKQVITNMVDNAYCSVEEGGKPDKKIIISTYRKGKTAYIEIEDNGVGIEKNKIDKIFDSFYTTKAKSGGTGLGLSIAYEIVTNKHNGEISVESKKGLGTKFIVKIPY